MTYISIDDLKDDIKKLGVRANVNIERCNYDFYDNWLVEFYNEQDYNLYVLMGEFKEHEVPNLVFKIAGPRKKPWVELNLKHKFKGRPK